MQTNRPYYIAPLLVEQPTWGGEYIANFKSITDKSVAGVKIGQAFELAAETMLTESNAQDVLFATATSIDESDQIGGSNLFSLQSLIDQSPEKTLGTKVVEKHGNKMPVLIKFTQAKSNSYQVHVTEQNKFGHWIPKPESWYFFEKGKATLGLNQKGSVAKYKQRCFEIYSKAQEISQQIISNEKTVEEGAQELATFIEQDHPRNYVNTIFPEAESIIDLSQGGIHHSWETDDQIPNGNIVYEVQADVKDDFCTLRSFDQGKFKDDGSVRKLTIEDYFTALETDPAKNDPSIYQQPAATEKDGKTSITTLFDSPHYQLKSIAFDSEYAGDFTTTTEGFHHLFVKEGSEVAIIVDDTAYPVKKGWSLFIPAAVGIYKLTAQGQATVLKTTA